MTVINHKSISGVTSITAPAGSDDLLTVHTNDTTERFRVVDSGAIVTGVTTASNFKTGTSNLHSSGVEVAGINVLGADTPIGTGATIYNSGAAVFTGILTATSGVGIGDSIFHIGDDNTQIRFPSPDTFAVDTGGTERLRITSGGEVKIMNTSGTVGLYFQSSSGAVSNFRAIGTNNQSLGYFFGNDEKVRFGSNGAVGINTSSPNGKFHIHQSSAGSVTAATDANDLVIESSTNVGMSLLTANDSQARIKFGDPDATNAGAFVYNHQNDKFSIVTGTGNRMIIGSDMISARTDYGVARTAGGYTFREVNEGGERAGMHSDASNHLIFKAGGANEYIRITHQGKVGIHTAAPAHNLDVVGNIRVHNTTPALYLTTNANTAESALIRFGDTGSFQRGSIQYDFSGNSHLRFKMGGAGNNIERLNIEGSSGNLTNTGSSTSYVTTQFASNFAKIDLRGTNIANSNHYILSYGEGHANDHEFHMVNTVGHLVFRTGASGQTERVRINSVGEMSIGGQHASSAYDPNSYGNPSLLIAGDDNADILTLMNDDPSPNNGDYASLGFRVAGQSTGSYSKAAIIAERNGGYNALDLVFAIGTDADATRTTTSHERLRINGNGRVGISHNLNGTSDYNRLMIHNPHSGSCWLQMTSTASGSGANTDGFSLGMNTSNIAHIWLRENAKMQFATNGSARAEITAQGTLVAGIVGTVPVNQAESGHYGGTGFSAGNAMGLMVKRAIHVSDADTKGCGGMFLSHTRNVACNGTTYNMITLHNREGTFIGDVYVGWSAGGAAAVRHYKFHCYYGASTLTDVNNPGGRTGSDSISVNISSSNDSHTFQTVPNKSNNSTERVTMTIVGMAAGRNDGAGGDYYTCTYN